MYSSANLVKVYDSYGLFSLNKVAGIGVSVNFPFGLGIGFGIDIRQCCTQNDKLANEMVLVIRAGVGIGASANTAPTGKGNIGIASTEDELPACMIPDIGPEYKKPFGIIDIVIAGFLTARIDLDAGSVKVGLALPPSPTGSATLGIYERRTSLWRVDSNIPCCSNQ